jgi:UDP-N-acetylglucosamine 2-epimerase (non-hydrolysing)
MRIINIVGARPNFMKIAPLMAAYPAHENIEPLLVHTGQHYDKIMSRSFFEELGIPRPDVNLEVGSGSHAVQTAKIMVAFEKLCIERKPDMVLVVGDVNSTIACAMVAAKLNIKIAHVEAGLRSFDRTMPEEVNRLLTDSISDLLFVSEQSGLDNLKHEGVDDSKVHFVGNVMIDTLLKNREQAEKSDVLDRLSIEDRKYAVMTLHRPSNVDERDVFNGILDAVEVIAKDLEIVFPAHPRTLKQFNEIGIGERIKDISNIKITDPMGYLDFLKLTAHAKIVVTDSGGIQEETTILKVPCLTLRANTERPITCTVGTNQLVGMDPKKIIEAYGRAMQMSPEKFVDPPMWDGQAAKRIAAVLSDLAG